MVFMNHWHCWCLSPISFVDSILPGLIRVAKIFILIVYFRADGPTAGTSKESPDEKRRREVTARMAARPDGPSSPVAAARPGGAGKEAAGRPGSPKESSSRFRGCAAAYSEISSSEDDEDDDSDQEWLVAVRTSPVTPPMPAPRSPEAAPRSPLLPPAPASTPEAQAWSPTGASLVRPPIFSPTSPTAAPPFAPGPSRARSEAKPPSSADAAARSVGGLILGEPFSMTTKGLFPRMTLRRPRNVMWTGEDVEKAKESMGTRNRPSILRKKPLVVKLPSVLKMVERTRATTNRPRPTLGIPSRALIRSTSCEPIVCDPPLPDVSLTPKVEALSPAKPLVEYAGGARADAPPLSPKPPPGNVGKVLESDMEVGTSGEEDRQ